MVFLKDLTEDNTASEMVPPQDLDLESRKITENFNRPNFVRLFEQEIWPNSYSFYILFL